MSRALALAAVLSSGAGLAVAVSSAVPGDASGTQPLPFNHRIHGDNGIGCTDCHGGAEGSAVAGLPRTAFCMECHGEDTATTPDKDRLKAFAEAGREVPWVRLYRLPAHVVFSHERHTALGGLACDRCHGDHGRSEAPPPHPEYEVLFMDGCLRCHEAKGASLDCIACHR